MSANINTSFILRRRLMAIYKLFGMCLMALCGALCGFFMNQSAMAKCEQADNLIRFIRYVRNQVECFGMPSFEILSGCERELLEGCGFYNCPCDLGLEALVCECEIYDPVCEKIVREFLCGFGKSYRDEQLRECDYSLSLLQSRKEEMFSELPKKKKINATLCISASLFIGLMLI